MTTRSVCLLDLKQFVRNFLTLLEDHWKLLLMCSHMHNLRVKMVDANHIKDIGYLKKHPCVGQNQVLWIGRAESKQEAPFSVEHACGGYPSIRYDELCHITDLWESNLICNPWLESFEILKLFRWRSTYCISNEFLGQQQTKHLRVFKLFAMHHVRKTLPHCYHWTELESALIT